RSWPPFSPSWSGVTTPGRHPTAATIDNAVATRLVRALGVAALVAAGVLLLTGGAFGSSSPQHHPRGLAIKVGPGLDINPVTQSYFTHQLNRAAKDGYDAAVVLLDTPGGLSTSMKTMFNAELNSKVPVIVYVSPDGARAASAGVWISEAADVLAMAPSTN